MLAVEGADSWFIPDGAVIGFVVVLAIAGTFGQFLQNLVYIFMRIFFLKKKILSNLSRDIYLIGQMIN